MKIDYTQTAAPNLSFLLISLTYYSYQASRAVQYEISGQAGNNTDSKSENYISFAWGFPRTENIR